MNNDTIKLMTISPAKIYISPAGNCEMGMCVNVVLAFSTACTDNLKMSNDLNPMYVDNALINANSTPNPKIFLMSLKGYFNPSTTQSVILATLIPLDLHCV